MAAARAPWSLKPVWRRWVESSMSRGCQAHRAAPHRERRSWQLVVGPGSIRWDWAALHLPGTFTGEDVPIPCPAPRSKFEVALTQHTVTPHRVAGPPGALAGRGTVHSKIPLQTGVVAAGREQKGGKCLRGERGPSRALLPALPGSPVSRLADASSRHWITAPHNALGAEELASIAKGASGAGAVAAAKTESEASASCAPEQGPPARTGGLILSVPGSCPAGLTVRAGPRLWVADLPAPAAGTQLEAVLAVEAGGAGLLAEGPVPARLASQAEAVHG